MSQQERKNLGFETPTTLPVTGSGGLRGQAHTPRHTTHAGASGPRAIQPEESQVQAAESQTFQRGKQGSQEAREGHRKNRKGDLDGAQRLIRAPNPTLRVNISFWRRSRHTLRGGRESQNQECVTSLRWGDGEGRRGRSGQGANAL